MPFEIQNGILKKYIEESGVSEVTVPNGVRTVGDWAFADCNHLKTVILPESVTDIGTKAFYHCTNLTHIRIPARVTEIGDGAFEYCYALTELILPDGITNISTAFCFECTSLQSIRIPDSVTNIGTMAFWHCTALKEITVPERAVGMVNAFDGTPWLNDRRNENPLVIVNGILLDGKACCGSVVIPDSVKCIIAGAFSGCNGLTEITVPEGITQIGSETFCECEHLQKVTLPSSLTRIGENAFSSCTNLQEIVISECVTSIGNTAFCDCWRLSVIRLRPDDPALHRNYDADTDEPEHELMNGLKMLRNGDYDANILSAFKYPLLFLHWLHTHDEGLTLYFREHLDDMMEECISLGDICIIAEFAQRKGRFFTQENIDRFMEMAQEAEQDEIFMILLNYKNMHFGFDNMEKLRL